MLCFYDGPVLFVTALPDSLYPEPAPGLGAAPGCCCSKLGCFVPLEDSWQRTSMYCLRDAVTIS
jgi:hypothetical protein